MDIQQVVNSCEGFQWDKGNSLKSWLKHRVSQTEAEQVILSCPLLFDDDQHSEQEVRHLAFGVTDEGRYMVVAFTVRGSQVRVISARDMNKKEKGMYEKIKTDPQV
jgi:uncharacterized DUF497 family protein